MEGSTPLEVSQRLVREARKRWMREEEEVIDDCTVIVSYLDHKPDGVASNLAAAQPPLSPTKRTSGGGAGSNKGTPTRGGVTPRSGGH